MRLTSTTRRLIHGLPIKSTRAAKRAVLGMVCVVYLCGALAAFANGQSETTTDQSTAPIFGLPLRAPGYELFYHDNTSPSAFANRWGYYDGWTEGRHDRQVGVTADAKDRDKYKLAPDHGQHPGLDRDTYKSLYRVAYLHGYDRGSKD